MSKYIQHIITHLNQERHWKEDELQIQIKSDHLRHEMESSALRDTHRFLQFDQTNKVHWTMRVPPYLV